MTIKSAFRTFLEHINLFKIFGNEAKFGFTSILPVFIALLLPWVYPLVIAVTYSNQTVVERTAVVLDDDNSAYTRQMKVDFDATQGLTITREVGSIDEGVQAVMSREADAFIFFPSDFSAKIKRFEQGNLKVFVYATNMMIYASAMTAIQNTVLEKNVQISVERIANPKGITGQKARNTLDPIQYNETILYSPTLAYGEYVAPLLFMLVFHQMAMLLLAIGIGYHREKDKEFRKKQLWLTDYFWRLMFYVPFILIGMFGVYGIYCPTFGIPCGNPVEIVKIVMLMTLVNFPIGAVVASFCKDKYTGFFIYLPTSLVFFSYSGYVWPSYSMLPWVSAISDCLTAQPASYIIRAITFKGQTVMDCPEQLYKMCKLFLAYLAIAFVIIHRSWWIYPFKKLFNRRNVQTDKADEKQSGETESESVQQV